MLIILSVLATFALLFFNPSPTTGGASQRYLMAGAFSLVTVFLIPNAPAGIAVYFIASGVWQMAQQARDPDSSGRCLRCRRRRRSGPPSRRRLHRGSASGAGQLRA